MFPFAFSPQVRGSTRRGRESVLCAVWLFQFVTSRKLLLYRPLRPLGTSPNLGEEGGCGFTTRARPWGGMVMCTSTTRAQLWVGKVNYTILPFAACHVVMRLPLCCRVLPVRHKLCKIGIANQNNSVNACRFRRKVVPLHRNSTEGMGD